jgi:transposase
LCEKIKDHSVSAKGGRPCADKRTVLKGIFWILDNGAKWKDLPERFGSRSTVHRWFRKWAQEAVFDQLMAEAGALVEQHAGFKLYECYIDGTRSNARGGGDGIGCTKAGKGVKIMIMVDAQGLPMEPAPHPLRLTRAS